MKIYGDISSGNCLKVKWVCDRLALPYLWIDIDTLKRETRTAEFLELNSAGQVPTVRFDDGRTLAQSNAIIRYLARGSALIPADDFAAAVAEARAKGCKLVELLTHRSRVEAQRFYARLGFQPSHVGTTLRF